jgi:BirA family biotin operon repressor/biotin-[acetyl-CoA-carboxylase] ligase
MNIIKLDAIDSTNSYIKKLDENNPLESFTVVLAEHQYAGQGQQAAVWTSERGKNLTFSILVKFPAFEISNLYYLSMAVSLSIIKELKRLIRPNVYIKWPNDILAGKDKIAGILIENIISGKKIKQSIVGIGLNVNQVHFSRDLKNATSLKRISDRDFELEDVLESLLNSVKYYIDFIERKEFGLLKTQYMNYLYKFETPSMFEVDGKLFMGRIVDVNERGELEIELENETLRVFKFKEIKFATNTSQKL